ncbi:MAG: prepilin-type N-terminal cleavage/methylation domain-containing protein [Chloroflexi bacterium]|nr:prepilin-type N-terminal cleavage/methylation domain-containing protein [Chloroflexota bacterium]
MNKAIEIAGFEKRGRTSRAYSLIEVLICLVILTLVFLGIASVFSSGHAFLKHSGNISKASSIAQNVLEQQRSQDFESLAPTSGQVTSDEVFNGAVSSVTFNYSTAISDISSNLKQITATVTWDGNVGRRTLTTSTLVFGNTSGSSGGSLGGGTGGGEVGGGDTGGGGDAGGGDDSGGGGNTGGGDTGGDDDSGGGHGHGHGNGHN